MKIFVHVAQHARFAAAARELRMSAAAVSKQIGALETEIGARLFDRTTRRVGLTHAGRVYLERCLECLQVIEDAETSIRRLSSEPQGLVRISAPIDFGACLMPVLARVMADYPNLRVDLRLSNRIVDLIEEGVDMAVRGAHALDGGYVARPLARTRFAIFGAPDYLRKHGRPRRPEDLRRHRSLVFAEPKPIDELEFSRDGKVTKVQLNVVMTTNNGDALRDALQRGIGLARLPSFLASADVQAGKIEPVLADWKMPEYRMFVVYPHRRFLSPNVRVVIEALQAEFGGGTRDPWWDEPPPKREAKSSAQQGRVRGRSREKPTSSSGGV